MRIPVLCALALVLLSGCMTDGGDGNGGGSGSGQEDVDRVKAAVDRALQDALPAIAAAVGGSVPTARGQFTGCGVGDDTLKYVVRGELHAPGGDTRPRVEKVRSALDGAGFTTTLEDDDLDLNAERDGATITFISYPHKPGAAFALTAFTLSTECVSYDGDAADHARGLGVDDYPELTVGS